MECFLRKINEILWFLKKDRSFEKIKNPRLRQRCDCSLYIYLLFGRLIWYSYFRKTTKSKGWGDWWTSWCPDLSPSPANGRTNSSAVSTSTSIRFILLLFFCLDSLFQSEFGYDLNWINDLVREQSWWVNTESMCQRESLFLLSMKLKTLSNKFSLTKPRYCVRAFFIAKVWLFSFSSYASASASLGRVLHSWSLRARSWLVEEVLALSRVALRVVFTLSTVIRFQILLVTCPLTLSCLISESFLIRFFFCFFCREDAWTSTRHQTNWSSRQSCQQGLCF